MERLALHESIAIFGLMLGLLAQNPSLVLPFAAVAILLNLRVFPNLLDLLESASR